MNHRIPQRPNVRSTVVVRSATEQELRQMASDMIRYLPDGLFPQLGRGFVTHWMKTFLTQRHGIALVAVTNDAKQQQVGFLIGSTDQVRHVGDVLRNHKWSLLSAGLVALSLRPRLLLHFLRTRTTPYMKRIFGPSAPQSEIVDSKPAIAVVTSLVVHPKVRGRGLGEMLVDEFIAIAGRSGSSKAELVTSAGTNGAGRFYEKIGWERVGEGSSKDGTRTHTYCHSLIGAEGSGPRYQPSSFPCSQHGG